MEMFVIVAALVLGNSLVECADWDYKRDSKNGPLKWHTEFSKYCSATENPRQSPINFVIGSLKYDPSLTPIEFSNYEDRHKDITQKVVNTGHSIKFEVTTGKMTIRKGPLGSDTYEVLEYHFHWGSKDAGGSEHQVSGKHHQAEMHIVHKNAKYSTGEFLKHSDGLAVVGVFIDIATTKNGETPRPEFTKVINAVKEVKSKAGFEKTLRKGDMKLNNLLPTERGTYYTYPGGLTTPHCNGVVTWMVFKEPIYVKKEQLETLFLVMDKTGAPLTNTYRPVQPAGKEVRTSGVGPMSRCLSDILTLTLMFLAFFKLGFPNDIC